MYTISFPTAPMPYANFSPPLNFFFVSIFFSPCFLFVFLHSHCKLHNLVCAVIDADRFVDHDVIAHIV